jgi:hypothetical protein
MINRTHLFLKTLLLSVACAVFSVPGHASFVGESVIFSYMDSGNNVSNASTPVNLTAMSDPELFAGDGSAIDAAFFLISPTSIDILEDSIVFTLRGGGPGHSAGFQTTGAPADAKYRISIFDTLVNLFDLAAGDTFAVALDNVVDVNLGTELMLTDSFIDLFIGSLGIGDVLDIGTITLQVDRAVLNPVPIPAALPLMLSALGLIGFMARRRRAA